MKTTKTKQSVAKVCAVVAACVVGAILLSVIVNELVWWGERIHLRKKYFKLARERANLLGKPLMVIGEPDAGYTNRLLGADYPCGDITLDLKVSAKCKKVGASEGDVHDTLPTFADNSHVIFVSYVLEYVRDLDSIVSQLSRIAGSSKNLFVVYAKPYTLWSRLSRSSSPSDPIARNVITGAPPTHAKITSFKL